MQWGAELYTQGGLVIGGFILAMLFYYLVLRKQIVKKMDAKVRERKDQFTGLASHYLLTPITIIQTAIAQLQEDHSSLTPERRTRLYDAIAMGEQRLWIIAEQLVLINQIDFNEMKLQMQVSDVPDTITAAIAAVDVFARVKKMTIRFDDTSKEVRQARCDARRLKQALIAILDNAIKFSMENTVVAVRLGYVDDHFVIEVEDQGIGMDSAVIQHLGEKFYRANDIYNFDYEGLGLGLHIADAIVRSHDGEIRFDSKQQRGTLVTITLPNL
jgi:signal transduction histidine kinase